MLGWLGILGIHELYFIRFLCVYIWLLLPSNTQQEVTISSTLLNQSSSFNWKVVYYNSPQNWNSCQNWWIWNESGNWNWW